MPNEWKLIKNYNNLYKIKNVKFLNLYKNGKWIIEDTEFTLKQKFDYAKKNFISQYGGHNSWTQNLFLYDYKDNYNVNLTLSQLKKGEYNDNKKSDNVYICIINFIKKNIYKTDDDNLEWLLKNHINILCALLEYRINKKQSISTFNSDIKMFARIFKIVLGDTHELYKKMSQLQTDLNRIVIEKETGKNTLNKYEESKFISFDNLLEIRDNLEVKFKESLEKEGAKSRSVWELHYKMLLLSCYTLTPCVRKELMGCKFAEKETDMNKEIDYIYVPKDVNKQVEYNFRIVKKGKPNERYIVGYDNTSRNKLSKLLRESLLLYKREWVFPLLRNLDKKSSIENVNRFFRNLIKGKTLGVNIIRSSYITWRNQNGISYNEMKEDAIRLRNSVETQMKDYLKKVPIKKTNFVENEIIIKNGVDSLQNEKNYKKEYYLKNKNKRKEYIKENRNKINARYHINNIKKTGKIPKQETLTKWKLYLDGDIWKSEFIS